MLFRSPTLQPTPVPTLQPTPVPSLLPTPVPSLEPTPVPTLQPTPVPTLQPTPVPTLQPTPVPSLLPTPVPSLEPTPVPTQQPTPVPTLQPTPVPTLQPTPVPTLQLSPVPTSVSSPAPSQVPTFAPTILSSLTPSIAPTPTPTIVTPVPTILPAIVQSLTPSNAPTSIPTPLPTTTESGTCIHGWSTVTVLGDDGSQRETRISDLEQGQLVLAAGATGAKFFSEIVGLPRSKSRENFVKIGMVKKPIAGGTFKKYGLMSTFHHTFPRCGSDKGEVRAVDLKAGDCLVTISGIGFVESTARVAVAEGDVTYSIELKDADLVAVGGVFTHATSVAHSSDKSILKAMRAPALKPKTRRSAVTVGPGGILAGINAIERSARTKMNADIFAILHSK